MDAPPAGPLLAPSPKSPPEFPDLYGKRRGMARVQMLEREIGFLEEELKSVERSQPASKSCKEVTDFVMANPDPLLPTSRKNKKSCGFRKWLCGMPCFNLSSICCCCSSHCSCLLKCPSCGTCNLRSCSLCDCISCNCNSSCLTTCLKPDLLCSCSCPRSNCCRRTSCGLCSRNCCSCGFPSCADCSCCRCKCSCLQCPKVCPTSCCARTCCNPCHLCC